MQYAIDVYDSEYFDIFDEQVQIKADKEIDRVVKFTTVDGNRVQYCQYLGKNYRVHGNGFTTRRYICLQEDFKYSEPFKQVFSDFSEVAHRWAHQTQPEAYARTTSDSCFYFKGRSIYSYGTHFEIARLVDVPAEDNPVVLFNDYTYSNQTTKHQRAVHSAIPETWKVFKYQGIYTGMYAVEFEYGSPRTLFDYGTNEERYDDYMTVLEYYEQKVLEHVDTAQRRRVIWTLRDDIRSVKSAQKNALSFIETFRCKSIVPKRMMDNFKRGVFDSYSEFRKVAERCIRAHNRKELYEDMNSAYDYYHNAVVFARDYPNWTPYKQQRKEIEKGERQDVDMPPSLYAYWLDKPELFESATGMELPMDIPTRSYTIRRELKDRSRLIGYTKKIKELNGRSPIELWKNGAISNSELRGYNPPSYYRNHPEEFEEDAGFPLPEDLSLGTRYAYLRYNEEYGTIETSKSTTLSPEEIRKAYACFMRYGEDGIEKSTGPEDYVNINGRIELARIKSVPAVNSEGVFRFGCHRIRPEEREYIVNKLNL